MALDLKRLKLFVSVCEKRSMTVAARVSNTTQPVLSYHIAELEKSVGEQLLLRRKDGVEVTEAGAALLAHARIILGAVDAAETALRERRDQPGGTVSIGLLSSIAPSIAPQLILDCKARYPQISLKISEGTSLQLRHGIERGDFDVTLNLRDQGDSESRSLLREDLYFVARRGTVDIRRDAIPLAEALEYRLLIPPKGHVVRSLVEETAKANGLALRIEAEIEGLATMKSLVAHSVGPTILGYGAIKAEYESGTFVAGKLVRPNIQREFILDETRNRQRPKAVEQVRGLLVQAMGELAR